MVSGGKEKGSKKCKLKFKEEQSCKSVALNPCFPRAHYPHFSNLHLSRTRKLLWIKWAFQISYIFLAAHKLYRLFSIPRAQWRSFFLWCLYSLILCVNIILLLYIYVCVFFIYEKSNFLSHFWVQEYPFQLPSSNKTPFARKNEIAHYWFCSDYWFCLLVLLRASCQERWSCWGLELNLPHKGREAWISLASHTEVYCKTPKCRSA